MECKFLDHGVAVDYDGSVKPCCVWQKNVNWHSKNNITNVNLDTWLTTNTEILSAKETLNNNQWPSECVICQHTEQQDRVDSIRGNGNSSCASFSNNDITLEIRPGVTCNFACQTCWPNASSRVINFYKQAGLITDYKSQNVDDFSFLIPVAKRIKKVNLLGGEPFYDKSCLKFLDWATENLSPTTEITIFTNGSVVNYDFIKRYPLKLRLFFSIDAVGRKSEYIRFGSDWQTVYDNYIKCLNLKNIEVGVNITVSIFNILYLAELLRFLLENQPSIITFGEAFEKHLNFNLIPDLERKNIIVELTKIAIDVLKDRDINHKDNTVNAIKSIINKLKSNSFDQNNFNRWKEFVSLMDTVKQISIADYCPELSKL